MGIAGLGGARGALELEELGASPVVRYAPRGTVSEQY